MNAQRFPYGGQAVLEGVMMRGVQQATTAVRAPDGHIALQHEPLSTDRRHTWERLPFLRGVLALWDALNLGVRSLNFSARVAAGEEHALNTKAAAGTLAISFSFAIALFFVLPLLLANVITHVGASPLIRELFEGVLRLTIFVGYLLIIGRLPDIQRVYGYHGAEHKTINAYEAGAPLTVSSVRRFTLLHPRCGTGFLLVVIMVSVCIFAFFSGLPLWERLLSRVVLLPIIAAIAYELLRLAALHYRRTWVRILISPSLALQHLTTREPDDTMITVAIAA